MLNINKDKLFYCKRENPEFYTQLFNSKLDEEGHVIYIGNYQFLRNMITEEINFMLKYLRKNWILIQNSVLIDDNVSVRELIQSRQDINKGLRAIATISNASEIKKKQILNAVDATAVPILPVESFEEKILIKLYASSEKQTANCPINEYFHCYLDVQFYILLIKLKCDCDKIVVETDISKILKDLMTMSRKYFSKIFNTKNSSFLCPCVKNFWLVILSITSENLGMNKFWDMFKILSNDDDPLFSISLLRDLAQLQHEKLDVNLRVIEPNYTLIAEKLKCSLPTVDDISNHVKVLYPFICELWLVEKRVEILLILWDYFSKRLNTSKKYQTPLSISYIEFTEKIDTVTFCPQDLDEDFELFIGLLLNYLKQQPNHWGKIKCRLFSQLSPFKIADLNEVGLLRVFELFIALMQVNQEELSKKISSTFRNLKENMITSTIFNIYMSFIIIHIRENRDVESITPPMVEILQNASENQNGTRFVKEFLPGFRELMRISTNLQLHQWTLLDTWITKYMATCYMNDLEITLQILLFTIRKINNQDAWSYWQDVFKKNVYPVLKQIGNTSSCPSTVGELAGEICISSTDLLNDAIQFFCGHSIMVNVTEKFICSILKDYPKKFSLTKLQEMYIMQSWVRICLFSTQSYDDITSCIPRLETVPPCIKEGLEKHPVDPFIEFIDILATNKSLFLSSISFNGFCETCFENLDKSIMAYLPLVKNEVVVLRIFTCLALTFLQCGRLLYDRHKTSTPLTKLVSSLLFPSDFLMGKVSHSCLNAIRKTWHLYFEAIIKLDFENDTYVQRILRDLISKYLPHYPVSESPIYLCLTRESSAKILLDKLCSIYFKHPTKENELNVTKALKILNEYVKSSTSVNLLKIVVSQTMFGLYELYIFHNQRNLALSLIMELVTSPLYDQLKDEVMKTLQLLTEKHLAFNTKNYFNLMNILAKTIPSDILILREKIIEKIKSIERIRGIGYDDNLRTHLNNLNASLKS